MIYNEFLKNHPQTLQWIDEFSGPTLIADMNHLIKHANPQAIENFGNLENLTNWLPVLLADSDEKILSFSDTQGKEFHVCRELSIIRWQQRPYYLLTWIVIEYLDSSLEINRIIAPYEEQLVKAELEIESLKNQLYQIELEHYPSKVLDSSKETLERRNLREMAYIDELTGLPNWRVIRGLLNRLWTQVESDTIKLSLITLDIADFTRLNSILGRSICNQLLADFAKRLKELTSEDETVAKLYEDNFLILKTGSPQTKRWQDLVIDQVQKIINDLISNPFLTKGHRVHLNIYCGISTDLDAKTPQELFNQAEKALKRAKKESPGTYLFYRGASELSQSESKKYYQQIESALTQGDIHVQYQPIYRLQDGALAGWQAFLRWKHKVRGILNASQFLEDLIATEHIIPIGELLFSESCRAVAQQEDQFLVLKVAPRQLLDSNFSATCLEGLKKSTLSPTKLYLDLTDGWGNLPKFQTEQLMKLLDQWHINYLLEPFRLAQRNLDFLHRSYPKILIADPKWSETIPHNPIGCSIYQSVTTLAEGFGARSLATKIETQEQLEFIQKLGYSYAQGYLLGEVVQSDALNTVPKLLKEPLFKD